MIGQKIEELTVRKRFNIIQFNSLSFALVFFFPIVGEWNEDLWEGLCFELLATILEQVIVNLK